MRYLIFDRYENRVGSGELKPNDKPNWQLPLGGSVSIEVAPCKWLVIQASEWAGFALQFTPLPLHKPEKPDEGDELTDGSADEPCSKRTALGGCERCGAQASVVSDEDEELCGDCHADREDELLREADRQ